MYINVACDVQSIEFCENLDFGDNIFSICGEKSIRIFSEDEEDEEEEENLSLFARFPIHKIPVNFFLFLFSKFNQIILAS